MTITLRARGRRALALVALSMFALPTAAQAHIQVSPSVVAPADPVQFTVLVPGEREVGTTKIELQMPKDVLPFSFGETPGWKRTTTTAADGSLETIVWTGKAAPDGFVELSFLAGTPEQEGTIEWKAIQTYADGEETAWIGAADTELPAARTTVSKDAPRQNAGGEGGEEADPTDATSSGDASDSSSGDASDDGGDSDEGSSTTVISYAALALAVIALIAAVTGRRRRE